MQRNAFAQEEDLLARKTKAKRRQPLRLSGHFTRKECAAKCKLQCPFVRTQPGTQIIMRPPELVGARNLSMHCCSFALSLSVFAYQQVDDGPSLEGGVSSWQPIDSTVESNGGSQGSVADSNVIIGQHLHGAYWPEIVFYWNVGRDQSAIEPPLLLLIGA